MINSILNYSTDNRNHKLGKLTGSFASVVESSLNENFGNDWKVIGDVIYHNDKKFNTAKLSNSCSANTIINKLN